ncbi:MAG: hypothetical protein ACW99E_04110 [Promethearchaeota archaeon]|jgi:hypothetical protein
MNTKNTAKNGVMTLAVVVIIICGVLSTSVSASISYNSSLAKGTEEFSVNLYDDAAWKTTVNVNSSPSDWFEGDTNNTGAKSKTTIIGWNFVTWQTFDVFISLFMTEYFVLEDMVILLGILQKEGYNETTINANYTNSYNLWYGLRSVWNFTINDYNEEPSYTDGVIVFKDPLGYKTVLDDYNELAGELNAIPAIQFSGKTFPNISADEFLWRLALNGLGVAKPKAQYLTDLIDELECENVSTNKNTLIFDRYRESDYSVELSYGTKGTMSSLSVKDSNDDLIFRIVSSNSEWMFYMIIFIIGACGIGLVIFLIVNKRKPKK